MERFLVLTIDGETIKGSHEIERKLLHTPYYWLLECELENVTINIINNILIWVSGILYWGDWKWGIWKNGEFRSGDWNGGVFLNGTFKGVWKKGKWTNGTFKGKNLTNSVIE